MEFKDRLKNIMLEHNITQKELAERANITEASMSKYINGSRTPRIDVIVNIANALGVSTDYLLGSDCDISIKNYFQAKTVLARGKEYLSEDDKKKLIRFLLED